MGKFADLQAPAQRRVGLPGLRGGPQTTVELLGAGSVEHETTAGRITITFPDALDVWPAYALKITPTPRRAI